MNLYLKLFLTFAQIGACTFGGGYAMLPILQREIVEKHGWATDAELTDYFAIGQCTPGIIAVNVATFIGHKLTGIVGGIVATLGVVFPSAVIIMVIAELCRPSHCHPRLRRGPGLCLRPHPLQRAEAAEELPHRRPYLVYFHPGLWPVPAGQFPA